MKKRILGMVLILSMLMAVVPIMASAAENGICGENVTWELDDNGTLTISGTGDMYDWNSLNSTYAPWHEQRLNITNVVINDGVTSIGDEAFSNCRSMNNISIPLSVTSIGTFSFSWCRKLEYIDIPECVTYFGIGAFSNCANLKSIEVPQNIKRIDDWTFEYCKNLTSIYIPNSVTAIGSSAFYSCTSLENIEISDNITSIGTRAFAATAFYNNDDNWENDVLYLDKYLLTAKKTISGEYKVKSNTEIIGPGAFFGCNLLTEIEIPSSVAAIGSQAFYDCTLLKNVNIPDRVTSLDDSVLSGCESLENVTIHDSVTSIGKCAFNNCNKLTDIYYIGTDEQWEDISIDENGNDCLLNANIHYYTVTTPDTYEIGEITPTETGVTLTVQTKETVSGKQTVVVACYDGNGSFIGAKTRQITASDVVQNISIDIDKSKTSAVKAFIWNDIGYMMPASRMQSLEL